MTRSRSSRSRWLADQTPHDDRRSKAQIDGLITRLGAKPRRVLDLGCGAGRVLVPLAEMGHQLIGIDRDDRALTRCKTRLQRKRVRAALMRADFQSGISVRGKFDAVLCLGNTFMTVVDVEEGVSLLKRAAALLKPTGALILDDFPLELWAEVTSGNWQTGVSADGQLQMVWEPGDNVFSLRRGRKVDPSRWTIEPGDERFRLWSLGELTLAAGLAGLSAPIHDDQSCLIALSRDVRQRRR